MDYIKQYLNFTQVIAWNQGVSLRTVLHPPRSDSPDPILSLNILTSIEQLKNDYRCGR